MSKSDSFVVKIAYGRVQLFRSSGTYHRVLCTGATSAVLQGPEVHVTMPDNKVKIFRTATGTYVRSI